LQRFGDIPNTMLLCIEGIQFEGMQIAFMPTRKEI
jgi:hypothetical protein